MKCEKRKFDPVEIIFSAAAACNLNCGHCFTNKNSSKLREEDAASFLKSCMNSKNSHIEKTGFSGGEPFLNFEFILGVTKFASENGFFFDRIMTNGVWWKKESELEEKLDSLFDAGFDGKFGLSFDLYHKESFNGKEKNSSYIQKISFFIKKTTEIFGGNSVEIQTVISNDTEKDILLLDELSVSLNLTKEFNFDRKTGKGAGFLKNTDCTIFIPLWREKRTLRCTEKEAWNSRKWFKDDFCEGPGNILFVHSDGKIAPCCGFANENDALIIGTVNQEFDEIMKNASSNEMIKLCFEKGLSSAVKTLKKQKKLPGKTDDICTFCEFICTQSNRAHSNL